MSKSTIFANNCFFAKNCCHQQNSEGLDTSRCVFWNYMCLYLRSKFQVPRIILTSFRQGVILLPTSSQIEPLKGSPRLGLRKKLYSWFIPFKSNLVWFRRYKWNINCHCAIEKRVASWYINKYINDFPRTMEGVRNIDPEETRPPFTVRVWVRFRAGGNWPRT